MIKNFVDCFLSAFVDIGLPVAVDGEQQLSGVGLNSCAVRLKELVLGDQVWAWIQQAPVVLTLLVYPC